MKNDIIALIDQLQLYRVEERIGKTVYTIEPSQWGVAFSSVTDADPAPGGYTSQPYRSYASIPWSVMRRVLEVFKGQVEDKTV